MTVLEVKNLTRKYKDFDGDVKIMEPEEITEWKWYNLDELPEPIFIPSEKMIKAYLCNEIYNLKYVK